LITLNDLREMFADMRERYDWDVDGKLRWGERHTPETLDERNQEFYRLASRFNLDSYDGMDVGPIDVADPGLN
jgi:hypothetical protein